MSNKTRNHFLMRIIISVLFSILLGLAAFYIGKIIFTKPISISLELQASEDDEAKVFYDTGFGFNEKESIAVLYQKSSNGIVDFSIPPDLVLGIRVDPGFNSDTFIINRIAIQIDDQTTTLKGKDITTSTEIANADVKINQSGQVICLPSSIPEDVNLTLNQAFLTKIGCLTTKQKNGLYGSILFLTLVCGILIFIFYNQLYQMFLGLKQQFKLQESHDQFTSSLLKFIQDNKKLFFISVILVVFSHGYELTSFSLSVDEELETLEHSLPSISYISLNRYGIFILKSLTGSIPVIPYAPFAISLILLAMTNTLLSIMGRYSFTSSLLFSLVFLSSPILSYYLFFNQLNAQLSFGIFLVTSSYFIVHPVSTQWRGSSEKKSQVFILIRWFLSVLFLAFAFAIYQAMMVLSMVVFMFILVTEWMYKNDTEALNSSIKSINAGIFTNITAFVVYKLGDYIFMKNYGTQAHKYIPNEYLNNFLGWKNNSASTVLHSLFSRILSFFERETLFTGESGYLLFIPVIGLIIISSFYHDKIKKTGFIILLIGFIISPFILLFALGGQLPYRTFFSLSIMIAGIWGLFHQVIKGWLRTVTLGIGIIIYILQTYTITFLFYKDHLCAEADKTLIQDLSSRIKALPWPASQKEYDVVLVGSLNVNHYNRIFTPAESHGFSPMVTGMGIRFNYLFLIHGHTNFNFHKMTGHLLLPCEHEEMPSWPASGSIKLVGTTALVKMSEPLQMPVK